MEKTTLTGEFSAEEIAAVLTFVEKALKSSNPPAWVYGILANKEFRERTVGQRRTPYSAADGGVQ